MSNYPTFENQRFKPRIPFSEVVPPRAALSIGVTKLPPPGASKFIRARVDEIKKGKFALFY